MIELIDDNVGRIMAALEERGQRDNTIVIFMSDNGHSEETTNRIRVDDHQSGYPKGHFYGASGGGNTGKWTGHKGTFLEGGIRVPAIVSYPAKLPKGQVRSQVITAMDWFPTVLDLCNVKQPADVPKLDGHNILPIINSPDAESEYRGVLHFGWGNKWAVRDGDWKLIGTTNRKSGKTTMTLHNLAESQPEVKNHAADKPDIVTRLKSLHDAWANDVQRRAGFPAR